MPVDSLTARQYEMFRDRDKACIASIGRDSSTATRAQTGQVGAQPSGDPTALFATGFADGRSAAEAHGTGGWFWGGFAGGLGLSWIGTALVYYGAANSASFPTPSEQGPLSTKHAVYVLGFNEAYRTRLNSKKKSSALLGGILGTTTGLLVVLSQWGQ